MIIRKATGNDAKAVHELVVQLGYSTLSEEGIAQRINDYLTPQYDILVAEIDGLVVGFISLHWFEVFHSPGKLGRITAFCVSDQYRSQGIGRKMMAEAEKVFSGRGCVKMEVTSNMRRTRTHEFYLSDGMREESKRFSKPLK